MSKFTKPSENLQKSGVTMGTRKSAVGIGGTKTTPVKPVGSMKDPKAPGKFPAPSSSPSKPTTDKGTGGVSKSNLDRMNRTPLDHLKEGTNSVVKTKEALFWQKNKNPITTVASNAKAVFTGKVANNEVEKLTPKQRGKVAVMGALNLVPGVGSVANLTNGVVTSVKEKNQAKKTEFNKGNIVYKTPVKSVPTETGTVKDAKANSKKSVQVINSANGGLKKNKK